MKEKNRIIAEKHSKRSMQNVNKGNPFQLDQPVDSDKKEKIREFCMRKYPNGPVLDQLNNIKQDKPGTADKKQGSHSLSQLHYFQNHHR